MKLIIAGGRDFSNYALLETEVDEFRNEHLGIDRIISGAARGADTLGAQYALNNGISLLSMPADWDKIGKSAGYRRNEDMAKVADACICFWNGKSKGTGHMIDLAKRYKLKLKVVRY